MLTLLRDSLSHRSAVPLLLALYVLPRALVLLLPVTPTSDAAWYFDRAVGLAGGQGYAFNGVLTAFWPVGWPATLSAVFQLLEPALWAAQLFNLLCATASGWLVLDLGRRIFRCELSGRCALLLVALYPNNIAYTGVMLTEVYFTFLLLAVTWTLVVARGLLLQLGAGALLGLAALVKSQTIVLVPVFVAFRLAADRGRISLKMSMAQSAVIVIGAACVIAPWSYRNFQTFGEFVLISTNGGVTLLTGNHPGATGGYTVDDAVLKTLRLASSDELRGDRQAKQLAYDWIRTNPIQFATLMPRKLVQLWAPDGEAEWAFQHGYRDYEAQRSAFRAVRGLNQAYYIGLMLLFAVGIAQQTRRGFEIARSSNPWALLPVMLAAFTSVIAMVFSGQSRFHFPVMPYIAMLAGAVLMGSLATTRWRAPVARLDKSSAVIGLSPRVQ